ncbi:MAG: 2-dehydropantoate 2-reductase [Spirochaetes bacterium]|nr:2-dehydropantoate 2-reductase [Spirochaetota bacterium]
MKAGIVGAGAVGSIFAYFFNRAKIECAFYEKDPETVLQIKKGLNVIVDDKIEVISIDINDAPDILKGCGIVFLFVKCYSTEKAVEEIKDIIDKNSIVVTLQNGIGNKEIISKYISDDRIVYGSTSIGATKIDANSVRPGGTGNFVIGGKESGAVKSVEELLRKANFDVQVTDNPDTAVWKKTIVNAGINPLGALLSIPNGMIINNEYTLKLQQLLVGEAVNVANAVGVKLDADEMIELTRSVCVRTFQNLCSMLQDVKAGRRTEIDNINGIIVEYGRQNSIDISVNEAVYRLIKAREMILEKKP